MTHPLYVKHDQPADPDDTPATLRGQILGAGTFIALVAAALTALGPAVTRAASVAIKGSSEVRMDTAGPFTTQGESRAAGWAPTFNPLDATTPGRGFMADPSTTGRVAITRTLDQAGRPIATFEVEAKALMGGHIGDVVGAISVRIDGKPAEVIAAGEIDSTRPAPETAEYSDPGNPSGREARDLTYVTVLLPDDNRTHQIEVGAMVDGSERAFLTCNARSGHLSGVDANIATLLDLGARAGQARDTGLA